MRQWTLALVIAATCGCSVIVEDAIRDPADGGTTDMDAQTVVDCEGATDGTPCGGNRICLEGICALSRCGDAFVDPATEECDDGNDVAQDGCEDTCFFSCTDAADCDDGLPCNGVETCGGDHVCVAGTSPGNGSECTQPSGEAGVCRDIECVAAGCGNGLPDAGEECDDDNDVEGDGCDGDCTFSCETDAECDDASVCTGTESCDVTSHVCVPGTAMTCDDASPCTSNECDAVMGCVYPLIDMDGDGHASDELGACGDDCNDMRDDVSPSAVELCGDALDSDCDGSPNPATTPVWYRDCDDDGYAVVGAVTMTACSEPPGVTGCTGWTTRVPISGSPTTYDCNDANASVRPNQTSWLTSPIPGATSSRDYDYDCDNVEELRYPTADTTPPPCVSLFGRCGGAQVWTSSTAPACGGTGILSSCFGTTSCYRATARATQGCH